MQLLRQSTVATVYVGPVLDAAGAAVTTAVLGDFRLVKNGTAATLTGATVTHDANGFYTIALTTGNTDTTGRLDIGVGNTAMSMANHRFNVRLASVFDALVTNATNATGGLPTATGAIAGLSGTIATTTNITSATGVTLAAVTHTGAVIPTVTTTTTATNVTTVNGLAANVITATSIASNAITSAKIAADAIGATQIAANAITSAKIATDAIGAAQIAANAIGSAEIADGAITAPKIATGAITNAKFAAGAIDAAAIANGAIDNATFAADTGQVTVRSNTAQAGSSTTITLDASASSVTDFYKNDLIVLTGGTGVGQGRYITAYNGTTKVATVSAWATNPDGTTTFAIIAADAIVGATAPTAAQVADEVQTRTIAAVTTVNGLAANAITAASIATGAFTAAKFAAGAFDAVWTVTTRTLSAAGVQAIWDALTSALTTAGSIGNMLVTRILGVLASGTHQPQSGDAFARLGAPAGASISADIAGVQADTNDIQNRLPATLDTGRMRVVVETINANVVNASALAADAVSEIQSGLATAASQTNIETKIDTIDGIVDAILVDTDSTIPTLLAAIDDFIDTEVNAIKLVTDRLGVMIESDGSGGWRYTVGSLFNAPSGGGGGGGDQWATTLPGGYTGSQAGAMLKAIYDRAMLIVAGAVTYTAMVDEQGEITHPIFIGDDYLAVHSKAFTWEINAIPGLTAATAIVKFGGVNALLDRAWNVTGSATDIGGGRWRLTCEMPKSVSGQLLPGVYDWTVEVSNAGGTEMTVVYSDRKVEVRSKPT